MMPIVCRGEKLLLLESCLFRSYLATLLSSIILKHLKILLREKQGAQQYILYSFIYFIKLRTQLCCFARHFMRQTKRKGAASISKWPLQWYADGGNLYNVHQVCRLNFWICSYITFGQETFHSIICLPTN